MSLPYYYGYQIVALMAQFDHSDELNKCLDEFCVKKEENDDLKSPTDLNNLFSEFSIRNAIPK